jgi:hypothetical protein
MLLARLIRMAWAIVAGIIVIAIVLVVLGANQSNDIVNWFHDAGSWLSSPFHGIFHIGDHKANVAVNLGLAVLAYSIVAALLSRLAAGADGYGRAGRRREPVV